MVSGRQAGRQSSTFIPKEMKLLAAIIDLAMFILCVVFSKSFHHCSCLTNNREFPTSFISTRAVLSVIKTRMILNALLCLVASTELNDQLYLY